LRGRDPFVPEPNTRIAMVTHLIRQQIQSASAHEQATGQLAAHLTRALSSHGESVSPEMVGEAVEMVRAYVEHVPQLLEELAGTLSSIGALPAVSPLLEGAAGYFLNPHDLIPDHLGMLGLLDDAYLAHRLFESLSDQYRTLTGHPLISVDLSAANRVVRVLLGPDLAARLDMEVSQAIQQVAYQISIANLSQSQYAASARSGDRDWGNAFEDRVAKFCAENGISLNW
jgi:uncharacterized membrane protein YkvA (DUF1232 family)